MSSKEFREYHPTETPEARPLPPKASPGLWLMLVGALLTAAIFWLAQERPGAVTEPVVTQKIPAAETPTPLPVEKDVDSPPIDAPKPADEPTVSEPSSQRTSRISREPRPLASNAIPEYPPAALRSGVGGTVVVRAKIDASGKPAEVSIAKRSGNRDLDRAAVQAVRRWKFQPAIRNGRATASVVRIPVDFKPI
ncbi:TonB family protein [Pseudoxanthomonas sp. UTMC 1351]|uniref:TonB family protein n=1 Tax=Pseudoxanthomonas sp. UTMC 1351 TaxID=2695853 RepID=UPI0034CECDA3